jgi:hypothetical protein
MKEADRRASDGLPIEASCDLIYSPRRVARILKDSDKNDTKEG